MKRFVICRLRIPQGCTATERVFSCYDEITLDGTQKKLFMNGMILDCGRMDISYPEGTFLRLKHDGDFLGVARGKRENGLKAYTLIYYLDFPI